MFVKKAQRIRNTAIFIGALLLAGCLTYFFSISQGMKQIHEDAGHKLDTLATALYGPTDKYSYLPGMMANHPIIVDALLAKRDPAHVAKANFLLEQTNAAAKTDTLYIIDDNGMTIASSNWRQPQSFVGNNFSFRPYFIDAMLNGTGRFYAVGKVSLVPGYYVSHEIRHDAEVIGVAVVKIDLSNLDARWDREHGEMTVTDPNGVVFLSSRGDWKYHPTRPLDRAILDDLARTRQYEGVLKAPLPVLNLKTLSPDTNIVEIAQHFEGRDGNESISYLMKSRHMPDADWTINVFVPLKANETRAFRSGLLATGTLAFVLLLLMYAHQTAARIKEREKSRAELEGANQQLATKNQELQFISDTLHRISITDHLTGTYTRRFFYESLTKLMSASKRHGSPLSLIMIDVDNFKHINDTYGHPVGDAVLQNLASSCRQQLREADVFARFGGEEFIVALPETDEHEAREVAERLRMAAMTRPMGTVDAAIGVTISSGIAQYRPSDGAIEDMIKRADEALYAAKNSGRNQVVVH
jgi:diguanylate cyclase (GGDEF)-like protein